MKRLRRSLFNFASLLGLVLCLATLVLAIRSYWVADAIAWRNSNIATSCGDLLFSSDTRDDPRPITSGVVYQSSSPHSYKYKSLWGVQPALAPIGFAYTIITGNGFRAFMMMVPLWFIALIAAILPALWIRLYRGKWRRERRRDAGLCPHCGYDLRATPDRCPECGTALANRKPEPVF